MTAHTPVDADAVVVGAGPTGLLLAGDLAAAGLSVILLERRPRTAANLTRAFAVHARTLELLDARGLADELTETGQRVDQLRLFGRISLHLDALADRTRFPYVLITPQYETERLLERRALSTGVDIRYDTELTSLHQDHDSVLLETTRRDGTTGRLFARYVIGADGHRSTVRATLGLPFPGRAVVRSVVLADVRLDDPPAGVLTVNGARDAFGFLVPFGDGWYRAIAWHRDHQAADDDPVDLDELRTTLRAALGTDHGVREARWISRFHSDERQVPHYRIGRAFLAGDAAHVHSPAGGLGMNTGLHDAANLSWKLAAAVRGSAPDPELLLDSYHRERHPVGRQALRSSGALIRLIIAGTPALRAARSIGAGVVGHLPAAQELALGRITGIGIGYPAPPGGHAPAGRRAPDAALADGGRLYEALRAGGFVLVTPPGTPAPAADRLRQVHWAAAGRTACVLVRPDGYVAWSASDPTPGELADGVSAWLLPDTKEPR
ncbi:FAD-dependent monooxygenase [Streptomyces sp. NPDC048603]|uniref:FAD-dependent monooxygenase n=1 Tax=Streptomyces sp. NPDC048603 TaxID=3365577 RepID=UPI00371AE8CA